MLLDKDRSLLVAVDFQSKLAPAIHDGEAAIRTARRLVEIARILEVPCLATEQYPKGLGKTVPDLAEAFAPEEVIEKLCFSAGREAPFLDAVSASGREQLVVMGMETHVCVLQTAMVMHEKGYRTFVVTDAVGSRNAANRELGLARMRDAGLTLVSAEMVAFEWLGRAATDDFKRVLPLIK